MTGERRESPGERKVLTRGVLIAALFYVAAIIPTWAARAHGAPSGQRVVSDAGEELAGRLRESSEEGIGLGIGVAENGDGVPGGEHRGRLEREAELCFEGLTAQQG